MLPCLYFKKKVKNIKLIFVKTEFHSNRIINLAEKNSNFLKIPLEIIDIDIEKSRNILINSKLRCYHCKKLIFSTIINKFNTFKIADGTNFSDTFEYRPGLKALSELEIVSPFKETETNKEDIVNYLIKNNLHNLISYSETCYATRINYNIHITEYFLNLIDNVETYLYEKGIKFSRFRVIDSGKYVIETLPEFINLIDENVLDNIKKISKYGKIEIRPYKKARFDNF